MSLKDFHLIFIICSVILSAGFGVWGLNQFQGSGAGSYLLTSAGSFLVAAGLAVYAVFFVRKLKGLS